MKLSICNPKNTEEIIQLFIKTFSDSEGQSEGELIGGLVKDFMDRTDVDDL